MLTELAQFFKSITLWYGIARVPDGYIVVAADAWQPRDADMANFDRERIRRDCLDDHADPDTLRWIWHEDVTPKEQEIIDSYFRVKSMLERRAREQTA